MKRSKRIIGIIGMAGMIIAAGASLAEAAGKRPKHLVIIDDSSLDTVAAPSKSNIARHPSEIAFDSLDWKIPLGDPYKTELANGVPAFIAVDSSLPLINIEVYIRSGSLTDPEGKEGLGSLMARLLRAGGTELYPADTLDELIDLYAMRFSFAQTETHIVFNAAFLSEYADTAIHIMRQMFFRPAFEQRRIDRERSIISESIRHRFVNPGPALAAAYRKHAFAHSAAAKMVTDSSLSSIKRDDIAALHKSAFGSGIREMIVAASGKFDRSAMIAKLNTVFTAIYTPECPTLPEIAIAPQTRALVVHKDITQAYVRMGLPLFKRPHPDYYAVSLMNFILGGSGFISRLGTRVRSDEGLTYSIHSRAESNYTYDGTLYVDFFTNTGSYPKAISIILEEMGKFIEGGVTENELENAKSSLISELPSMFRSPGDIVSTYLFNEFFGRAPDHYVKYPDELRKLTLEDIQNAARKYINAGKITYTIVGDTAAINAAGTAAGESGFFVLDSLKSKKVITADEIAGQP